MRQVVVKVTAEYDPENPADVRDRKAELFDIMQTAEDLYNAKYEIYFTDETEDEGEGQEIAEVTDGS
jgi:Mg2+/Co2+ transporter CorC